MLVHLKLWKVLAKRGVGDYRLLSGQRQHLRVVRKSLNEGLPWWISG